MFDSGEPAPVRGSARRFGSAILIAALFLLPSLSARAQTSPGFEPLPPPGGFETTPEISVRGGPVAHGPSLTEEVVANKAIPSVVQILTPDGWGTGFMVSEGILTAEHVVSGENDIRVYTSDGRSASATVSESDNIQDVALLSTNLTLQALAFESATEQDRGEPLLVLGYPATIMPDSPGGPATTTRGVLSSLHEIQSQDSDVMLVQTDALVNHGNSGGPLVNLRGAVIGVVTLGDVTTGFNFAIATESIRSVLAMQPPIVARPPWTGDPRDIAINPADLGSDWQVVGYNKNNDKHYFGVLYGRDSGDSPDLLVVEVNALPIVQDAWRIWATTSYAKLHPSWDQVAVDPIGDVMLAERQGTETVIRTRERNVLIRADLDSPSGSLTMDDLVPLVNVMVDRANAT